MDNFSWTTDASEINGDFDRINIDKILVRTTDIDKFLKDSDTSKYFLVGPKGTGKTLLLKLKSKFYRDKNWQCIPRRILCEKLTDLSISLSSDDLNKFKNKAIWEKTWELALYILILRRFSIPLPKEIVNVIGEDCEDLCSILYCLLRFRRSVDDLHSHVAIYLRPKVLKLQQEKGVAQVAVFIDNIDEAFDKHVGDSFRNASKINSMLDPQVWINAQISILTVARSICQSNPHIKIFLAVRSEAYHNYNEPLSLQLKDNCIFLTYTKEQVREILNKNIIDTPDEDLVKPKSEDLITRIAGLSTITNRFVLDQKGEKITESLYDFIYRHTFGRPREIIEMGKNILNIPVESRTEEAVYDKINEISNDLFNQLKLETIPYFQEDIFRDFCLDIGSNIYNIDTAGQARDQIKEIYDFDNVNSYLYRLGILGVPKKKDSNYIQTFLPVAQYSLKDNTKIPEFEWFFLHPATYWQMKDIHMSLTNFCNRHNIVGYNQHFTPPDDTPLLKQVHLGLDRDCLSIIIPEIYNTKCLSVYLIPSPEWSKLETCKKASFRYDDKSFEFLIYHDKLNNKDKENILNKWAENASVIFYTKDLQVFKKVVNLSETISFSQMPYLNDLMKINYDPSISKQIYLCQRNLDTYNQSVVKKKLLTKSSRFRVDVIITDRFLYRQFQVKNEEELVVYVTVEEYSLLICLDRDGSSVNPSLTVRRPNNTVEFEYLSLRQKYFVEGLYQLYKILAQKNLISRHQDQIGVFQAFIYLQLQRILRKFSVEKITNNLGFSHKFEFDNSLKSFAEDTLIRLDSFFKSNPTTNKSNSTNKLDRAVFPSENEFYNYLPQYIKGYTSQPTEMKTLYDCLGIQPNDKLSSIFISYSFKDSHFVKIIADKLFIRGIKVFLFEYDNPLGQLKEIMAEMIRMHDKVLFVCSENSIKSHACQFELSRCLQKHNDTWEEILIPIRLDRYILDVKEHNIPEENRALYWKNIQYVTRNNIKDYKSFIGNISDQKFELYLDEILSICKGKK